MKVKLSSPCMAMLMYEASKSQGHCEGCLYGETSQETTTKITDSNMTCETENILSIHSIGELPLINGAPNCENNVMGWFKFCRRRSSRLTIREKSIHKRFCKHLEEKGEPPSQFISILMQEAWCESKSTYGWKFSTYVINNRRFEPCKVEIANLKASSCGTYMPYPIIHQQQRLPQVKSALLSLEGELNVKENNFPIVECVKKAGDMVLGSLMEIVQDLETTDVQLSQAYDRQEKLKLKIKELNDKLRKPEIEVVTETKETVNSKVDPDVTNQPHSSDDYSSESSEGEVFCGNAEKALQLLETMKSENLWNSSHGNPGTSSQGNTVANDNLNTLPSYAEVTKGDGPFDNLVDLAKADLTKKENSSHEENVRSNGENSERVAPQEKSERTGENEIIGKKKVKNDGELLREFNDERPWSEKTRAGRKLN